MTFIDTLLGQLNPWTVFFLMFLESTVFPVPSELVVAPAAYIAMDGQMSLPIVILASTLGAMLGASTNYFVALYVGRPVVYRFANSRLGHACLLNQEKVERSERYFDRNGVVATFTGRFIPVIRHLISIPAGLSRMHYPKFLLYTGLGAGLWNCILAALGCYLHTIVPRSELNATIEHYNKYIIIGIIAILLLVVAYFVVKHYRRKE